MCQESFVEDTDKIQLQGGNEHSMNGKNLNLKAKSDLLMVGDDYKSTILLGNEISLGRSDDYTFVLPPQWDFQF